MTSGLRIVAVLPAEASFAYDWASAASLTHEVIGVRIVPRGSRPESPATPFRLLDVVLPKRVDRLPSRVSQLVAAHELIRTIGELEEAEGLVDVVHGHFYSQARILCELRRRTGIPFVLTEHSTRLTGDSAAHKPLTTPGFKLARRGYAAASTVVFVSEYLRRCAARLGLSPTSVVIGNPLSEAFLTSTRASSTRRQNVVWVGRLEADKDPLLALHILDRLRLRLPSVTLHVIGDGPDRGMLERQVAAMHLEGQALVHGRLGRWEIASLLREASAFLSTSSVETFGIAVAEAALAGVPIVAPDLPPLIEVLEGIGSFYPRGDIETAVDRLVSVLEEPPSTAALAESLWARFSPQQVATELEPVYESAVRRGREGAEWGRGLP